MGKSFDTGFILRNLDSWSQDLSIVYGTFSLAMHNMCQPKVACTLEVHAAGSGLIGKAYRELSVTWLVEVCSGPCRAEEHSSLTVGHATSSLAWVMATLKQDEPLSQAKLCLLQAFSNDQAAGLPADFPEASCPPAA